MKRKKNEKGVGRKTTWASGIRFEDTKLVRVPVSFAKPILEVAHWLDAGEISIDEIRLLVQCKGFE